MQASETNPPHSNPLPQSNITLTHPPPNPDLEPIRFPFPESSLYEWIAQLQYVFYPEKEIHNPSGYSNGFTKKRILKVYNGATWIFYTLEAQKCSSKLCENFREYCRPCGHEPSCEECGVKFKDRRCQQCYDEKGFYRIRNDWVKGQIFDTCYGNNRNFGGVFKFRRLREVAGTKEDSGILKSDGTYLKYYHAETITNDKGGIITFTPNIVIVKKSSLKLVKQFSSPSNQESPLGELAAMQFVQRAKNGPDTCLLSIEELRNLPNHGLVTSIAGFIEFRFHDQFFPDPSKGYDHLYSIVPDCGVDIHTWAHRTYELGIVPEDVCRNIFFQLLNVLTYLRGRKLCHRDICDQNLVWDPVRNHLTLIDLAQVAWAGENPGPRIVDGKVRSPSTHHSAK